jgi:hypothetical protein
MPVVDVRVMRVLVCQHAMQVRMDVRFFPAPGEGMRMLVVGVMAVPMAVFQRFVGVRMHMLFSQVQPDSQGHQGRSPPEQQARHLRPQQPRDDYAKKRCHRKVSARAGRAQGSQSDYE